MTTVGIIGVGYLGECLAVGLANAGVSLVLSPRNPDRVARLAEQFGCRIAVDNAQVVAQSDLVFLATRPGDIVSTAKGLPWREGQKAVSVAAGVRLASLASAVSPARAFRAMPIAASRIQSSPTSFCPVDPLVEEIFNKTGSAHPLDDEDQFEAASIFGAFYALVYPFIGETADWAEAQGLAPVAARELTARMVQAAAEAVIHDSGRAPRELLNDLMTPGGITEEGLKVLEAANSLRPWSDAMDASRDKARGIDPED